MPIKPLPWDEWTGATVRIYRNLNFKAHPMSIQAQVDKRWRVIGHVTSAVVSDVAFKIQEGGRQRVIRDRCKNVHAWGQGTLVGPASDDYCPIALGYNPYEDEMFLDRDTGARIARARILAVRNNLVFVSPDAINPTGENHEQQRPLADNRGRPRIISIARPRGFGALVRPGSGVHPVCGVPGGWGGTERLAA